MNFTRRRQAAASSSRGGFSLVELLVVICIIGFLAVAVVTSMYGAAESAKRMRTQQTIGKLNVQLMPRWESYMTRRLPMNPPLSSQAISRVQLRRTYAQQKLWAMRELQRMDFPDRYSDLTFTPLYLSSPNTNAGGKNMPYYSDLSRLYQRMILQWTGKPLTSNLTALQQTYQSPECLYLTIMMSAQDTELVTSSFTTNEIGDADNDNVPEFLDAWGNPIAFLRWAPGFSSDMQPTFSISPTGPAASLYPKGLPPDPITPGNFLSHYPVSASPYIALNAGSGSTSGSSANAVTQYAIANYHDGFDPLEIDPGPGKFPVPERGYNLVPLIVSAGPDGLASPVNAGATSSSPNTSDVWDPAFGLHWGLLTPRPAAANPMNTDDDPYAVYSATDGTNGSTQRGTPDNRGGSYDNIHSHFLRTRP
ncbi:MAG TPA: type II secretion system protein [Tepidisphaeraceae bacterium]|nr:type II secretion system protein [Tepidisphaeraceae bacterium]